MSGETRITPVILSGGAGTRLWPMSVPDKPKQFLPLAGAATMFEATIARVSDAARYADPLIVANARHADLIEAQLGKCKSTLILEPVARNTAPAIALAALHAESHAPLLVMPSDHVIADESAFQRAIDVALPLANDGWLVTFGIAPDGPETGYGYIQTGEALEDGAHRVARFVEKPDRARAEAMIASGDHVWNGGIFLFRADAFLGNLAVHAPDILAAAQKAMRGARLEKCRVYPEPQAFAASPADSIDYAVMEKAAKETQGRVAVVPVSMGWSDIGSWDALHSFGADAAGDAHSSSSGGEVIALDTVNCLLKSDGVRIAAVGVSDLIVVASGNDVLILPRGQSQDVKRIVEALKDRK